MIVLGYPGDMHTQLFGLTNGTWGALSTIPFLYIMYVLFVEISKSLASQSAKVQGLLKGARLLLVATWGVYPITFILAMGAAPGDAPSFSDVVAREIGYSIADILAKCVFGLIIFTVARIKSAEESKEFAAAEHRD
jgi:bacteriorhodopsin